MFSLIIFLYCSYNPENYVLDAQLHPEKSIILDSDYEISGKVLILPIVGKGRCKIVLGNIIINSINYF